jgi:hypothetical protein
MEAPRPVFGDIGHPAIFRGESHKCGGKAKGGKNPLRVVCLGQDMIDPPKRPEGARREPFLIGHDEMLVRGPQPAPMDAFHMDDAVGHLVPQKRAQNAQIPGPGNTGIYAGFGQGAFEDTDILIQSEPVLSGNNEVSHDELFG